MHTITDIKLYCIAIDYEVLQKNVTIQKATVFYVIRREGLAPPEKAPIYSIDIKTDTPERASVFLCYFLISTNTSSGRLNILGIAISVDGFQSPLLTIWAVSPCI